uniref:Si:dkey-283j8.1 n=1 Tax=Oncorhynchus mykiss TaxID=8022 RepID=A0A8C7S4Q0_ONCMY
MGSRPGSCVAGRDRELMKRRNRMAIWLVLGMFCLSLVLVILGIYTTTRTESLSITGYASGVILVASIVFLSFGIIASFLCLVVDGVFIVFNMDVRPLKAGRCQFYTSGNSYIYENYYASVPCQGLTESCKMKVRSGTCYCCDLYDCANGGYINNYYEFVGVRSCGDVLSLYVLIWVLTSLNLVAFFLGILTTAVLGSIKDKRTSQYFSPAAGTEFPQSDSSVPPVQTPTPLYNLLPYKPQSFSV